MDKQMETESKKKLDPRIERVIAILEKNSTIPKNNHKNKGDFIMNKNNGNNLNISNTIKLRVEALKLAYDIAYKIGNFVTAAEYESDKSKRYIEDDIEEVFAISDMNLKYLMNNNNQC